MMVLQSAMSVQGTATSRRSLPSPFYTTNLNIAQYHHDQLLATPVPCKTLLSRRMFRRPATLATAIPCAVLVYLSLTPAGHFLARKQLKDLESKDQDSEPAAMKHHKNGKVGGHQHAKTHESKDDDHEHVEQVEDDKQKGR